MPFALVSPDQIVYDYSTPPKALGAAVVQVADATFPVVNPLEWVQCDDTIVAYQFYYANNTFTANPTPPPKPKPIGPTGATGAAGTTKIS